MNKYQSDFIANLIYYREKKGFTQSTLAAVCDCSKGNIGGIESIFPTKTLDKLIFVGKNHVVFEVLNTDFRQIGVNI